MPQEFYVLKCFSCETFQVHIVKKAKKWECKMCGAKQSLKRNYGKGSSKDCRNQVMKLNELRLTKSHVNQTEDEIFDEAWDDKVIEQSVKESKETKPSVSKWAEYVEENEPESEIDDENNSFMEVDKKKKRVKKMPESCYFKNKKVCKESNVELSKSHEKAVDSSQIQNFDEILGSDQTQQNNISTDFNQFKNETKHGKYAKYLQDEELSSQAIQKATKTSNIFETSVTDLDDVLNF